MPKPFNFRGAFQDGCAKGVQLHLGCHNAICVVFCDEILVNDGRGEDKTGPSFYQWLGKIGAVDLQTGGGQCAQAVGDHTRGCFSPAVGLHDLLVLANARPIPLAFHLFDPFLLFVGASFARRCAVEGLQFPKDLADGGQSLLLAFCLLKGHCSDEIAARNCGLPRDWLLNIWGIAKS